MDAVRMVLSGVARAQARIPCGRNLIAQMLCGSGSAKMAKLRLNKLSTFGLLKHLKQEEVLSMIDALIALRCLQQTDVDRYRPVIELTEFGGEVMRGKASLSGKLPLPAGLLWKLQGQKQQDKETGRQGDKERGRQGDKETRKRGDVASPVLSLSPCLPVSLSSHPSHYWTQRLLAAGFTVDECAAIRGLAREVVLEHARQADDPSPLQRNQ
jgi:superfamily II DNA helicase RecQ